MFDAFNHGATAALFLMLSSSPDLQEDPDVIIMDFSVLITAQATITNAKIFEECIHLFQVCLFPVFRPYLRVNIRFQNNQPYKKWESKCFFAFIFTRPVNLVPQFSVIRIQ